MTNSIKFDRAVEFYDETRGFPAGIETPAAALIAKAGLLDANSRVLEIGVGTGRIALPLAAEVGHIIGLDLSRLMMQRLMAKQNGEAIHLTQADGTRLPFSDNSFDAVVTVHVFHLIPNWPDLLSEIKRVLRPNAPLLYARGGTIFYREIWETWNERLPFEAPKRVGVSQEQEETFLREAGWEACSPLHGISYNTPFQPIRFIEWLQKRFSSSMWELSDEQLALGVEVMRNLLNERYSDLEQEVLFSGSFSVQGFSPPA